MPEESDSKSTKASSKSAVLGAAGESGHPQVHYLMAVRDALQRNRDDLDPPKSDARDAAIADIDAKIAGVDKELAELGYRGK